MRRRSHLVFFRYLAYSLEILVLFLLQQTPYLIPELWGIRPVLLFPAALAIALYESETVSMIFGAICGLLVDFGHSTVLGLHAALLAVLCYLISLMVVNLFKTNLFTALLLGCSCIILLYLFQWLFFYLFQGYDYPGYALWRHYLPRMLYTMLFLPVAYYFNRAFALFLREPTE